MCIYISAKKKTRRKQVYSAQREHKRAKRERKRRRDQSVFVRVVVLECASHFWHFFPGKRTIKTRANKQSCAEKQSAQKTHLKTNRDARDGRSFVTHSLQNVNAAIPRREPSGPGKRRLPVGPFRRVRDVQGDVFEVFTGTTHMFSRSMCTRDGITRSLILNSSSFTRSKWWLYINVKTETKIGREQV